MSYEIENYRKKYSSSIRVPKDVNDQLREVLFRPIVTGAERRKEIIRLLKLSEYKRIPVNQRHCIIVSRDADFQFMIKRGIGRLVREYITPSCARTYFELI